MRRGGVILTLLALVTAAGCKDEPSFDERYEAAEKRLEKKAAAIDRELEKGLVGTPPEKAEASDEPTPQEAAPPT